ncbi:FAD-dependent oxidoreductase [Leptolyngbya sp. 7M]|uniref:FAD-dependent oxidoreductase n=1 Tax=Leptolyngbya sp. 7M TaxID=2812896 RepID=UPI001B8B1893|nr:NAD(P)/FAD-dependent oxidoreductase [Leptolyngbya sp. 7M]QYO66252.1 FAD-dependent monooxygenase [Leptolyngbya sp. 7M]
MSQSNNIVIIGAGLAGSLLSIYLARRGYCVTVYEARGDMRKESVAAGRSINLALSDRGIAALREIGMDEFMLNEAVPMYGRMIHDPAGTTKLLPYSGREGEYINSVSRAGLNIALMNEAEKYEQVQIVFNERCRGLDIDSGEVFFSSRRIRADTVFATDGAGSPVRQAMQEQMPEFQFTSVFLDHGYKELHIPPGPHGSFLLEKNVLHIWPRHQFMMIALPNFDGSFTCTLFLDKEILLGLDSEAKVLTFFELEFPDAVPLMPALVDHFFSNPIGELGTLKCWPWHIDGKVLLVGDSAHAMVPFYGQGMNCAFEDVRTLNELLSGPGSMLTGSGTDWRSVFENYSALRKSNTEAIQDMAEENFYEMRDATADPVFQRKRELETKLEQMFPDYFSKYSMVTFREDLPYSVARTKGTAQDKLLMEICANVENISKLDLDKIMDELRKL